MRVLVGILAIILVSGCSSMGVKPIEIFTTEVERQPLALKPITVEQMEQIQVIIVTSKTQKDVFERLVEQGIDPVIFGFTDLGWEQLQYNMALYLFQFIQFSLFFHTKVPLPPPRLIEIDEPCAVTQWYPPPVYAPNAGGNLPLRSFTRGKRCARAQLTLFDRKEKINFDGRTF